MFTYTTGRPIRRHQEMIKLSTMSSENNEMEEKKRFILPSDLNRKIS